MITEAKINIIDLSKNYYTFTTGYASFVFFRMLELPSDWHAQWKDLAVVEYKENDYLISPGDRDNCILVVLEGIIAVFITVYF